MIDPLDDTSPQAHAAQMEMLRRLTPGQRAAIAIRLSNWAIWLSRRTIARQHPDWTDFEVKVEWARIHYGEEIADRLRRWNARE